MSQFDILLASFNGAPFLQEQLSSILHQSYLQWQLIVSDDGSTDGTLALLNEYAQQGRGKIVVETNRQPVSCTCRNFASLMERSSADYVMFCDQDDIWLPDKLTIFLAEMQRMEAEHGRNTPILVHSDLKVLRNGQIHDSFWKYQKLDPSKGETLNRLLVQNTITGCATMINAPLRELCRPIPECAIMHDWWVALVAASFGKISHLATPTVIYRQHGGNTIGAKEWGWRFIRSRLSRPEEVRQSLRNTQKQATAFLERYQTRLSPEQYQLVKDYATLGQSSFWERRRIIFRGGHFKNGLVRNLGLLTFV